MVMINRLQRETTSSPITGPWSTGDLPAATDHMAARGRSSTATSAGLLIVADLTAFLVALSAASFLALETRDILGGDYAPIETLALSAGLTLAGVFGYFTIKAHYHRRLSFWSELGQVLGASVAALAVTGFFAFWTGHNLPHLPLAATWLLFPALAVTLRVVARRILDAAGLWRKRVLIVGTGETSRQTLEVFRSESRLGYEAVEIVSPRLLDTFHAGSRLARLLEHFDADLMVLATEPEDWPHRSVIQSLLRARVPFVVMRQLNGLPAMGCEQTAFFSHDTVMLSYRNNLARPIARFLKVAFDVTAAAFALLVLAPLFLVIAAAIKLDGGPIFFAHRRIGANGRMFSCLKFRSMVLDSDRVLREVLDNDPAAAREWADTQKLRNDPRITWIGDLLRKTSLDELPQLVNVVRLEMSLVGPRPIVAAEVPKYADDIAFYHETRPGLTGLWQVSGRSETSYGRRVQLDSWYVKNWTMGHDLAIIAKTVPAVLKRRGAV